jgi:drug/metabolite transporter (DMT)-like permease
MLNDHLDYAGDPTAIKPEVQVEPLLSEKHRTTIKFVLAFAAIYLIWGSTFLAIRFAIETLPGMLMAAVRFIVSGATLCIWARCQGARLEEGSPRRASFISALLLLLLGHGSVVLAIHWVPSGLAALLISTTPLWVALFEWAAPGGKRPGGRVTAGILMSFLGILILIGVGDLKGSGSIDVFGAVILVLSSISWAIGTIYSRSVKVSTSPLMTSGMQMLWGGALLFVAAMVNGDLRHFNLMAVSFRSVAALLYLIVFGSIIAFTSYSWLIRKTSPSRVITSAYVNPVVAVLLGAAAGEPLTYRMMLALLTIVLGVFVTTNAKSA